MANLWTIHSRAFFNDTIVTNEIAHSLFYPLCWNQTLSKRTRFEVFGFNETKLATCNCPSKVARLRFQQNNFLQSKNSCPIEPCWGKSLEDNIFKIWMVPKLRLLKTIKPIHKLGTSRPPNSICKEATNESLAIRWTLRVQRPLTYKLSWHALCALAKHFNEWVLNHAVIELQNSGATKRGGL